MKNTTKALLASVAALAAVSTSSVLADDIENTMTEHAQEVIQQTEAQEIAEPVAQPAQVIESENVSAEPVAQTEQVTEPVETTEARAEVVTEAAETTEPVANEQAQPESQNEIGTVDEIDITPEKQDNAIKTWDAVKGTVKFHVDGQAAAGDRTTIQLPSEIELTRIPTQDIDLKTNTDVHFASAHFDNQQNQIVVNYNENAAGLQNIEGGFDFYYKLNLDVVKEVKDIELAFVVNNKQKINHTLKYVGIGTKTSPTFEKTSWQDGDDGTKIRTSLAIGKDGSGYDNMVIEDDIAASSEDNATYDYDSFAVRVGNWEWSDIYGWQFASERDITSELTWLDKQSGQFKIAIPESYNGWQINITYNLTYSRPVDAGETINNKAILKARDKKVSEWNSYAAIFNLSGWINGDKVVQEIPTTYPTVDKPEIPIEFEVPNTYPVVDKPELKIDLPKTPAPKADKPVIELTTKAKHDAVIKEKAAEVKADSNRPLYAASNYQAKLPETGEGDSHAIYALSLVLISSIGLWIFNKRD